MPILAPIPQEWVCGYGYDIIVGGFFIIKQVSHRSAGDRVYSGFSQVKVIGLSPPQLITRGRRPWEPQDRDHITRPSVRELGTDHLLKGEWPKKWENPRSKTGCAPLSPQDRVTLFAPSLLKGENLVCPSLV